MVVAIWLIVAVLNLARLLYAIFQTIRWRNRSIHADEIQTDDRPVRQSNDVEIPVTIGVLRHTILFPLSVTSWNADRLQMVIDHEHAMSHVMMYFGVWSLQRHACDDHVLQRGVLPVDYARELVSLAAELSSVQQASMPAVISISPPPIEARIKSVLNDLANRQTLRPTGWQVEPMSFTMILKNHWRYVGVR